MTVEKNMVDRRLLGDVAFAILIALPALSLSSLEAGAHKSTAVSASRTVALTAEAPGNGRLSLMG
jgi:hypothetical protein